MPTFDFIESAIIFGLDRPNLKEFKYAGKDFAIHQAAYSFITSHFDEHGEVPSSEVLNENFPTLDESAKTADYNYAFKQFQNQVLQRKIMDGVQSQKDLIRENPKQALSNIMSNLIDVEVIYDEDVKEYDSGGINRLWEYRERTKKRKMGDGLMGIPTSFESFNDTGVGWMPGELIAMFARPTVGKTWMCVHAAATAVHKGFKTLLISTEMPITAINMRMDVVLGHMLGHKFSHKSLRRGDPMDEEAYEKFLLESNKKSLLVCDRIAGQIGISLDAINSLIRKHNPEFVVIDGVYLIATGDAKKAIWEQSHSLFYGLKNLATGNNLPIMVTTQATREASNLNAPPRADQVAFGDALLRAADVAMAMYKAESDEDKRMVAFQKYRDGEFAREQTAMQWDVDSGNIEERPDYTDLGDDM